MSEIGHFAMSGVIFGRYKHPFATPSRPSTECMHLNPIARPFYSTSSFPAQHKLTVMLLNSRSLRNKNTGVSQLVHQHNPDVICLNETWLDSTISDIEIAISGYSVLRNDHQNQLGGGVLLLHYYALCLFQLALQHTRTCTEPQLSTRNQES